MSKKIKIMLAEDHALVRQGYLSLFSEIEDFKVIGDASNGALILNQIRKNQPDILISDIEMPEMNGYELAKTVNKEFPNVKIIFLSMYYSYTFASEMISNGVNACLPKECDIEVLETAIRQVYNTGYYFNPSINRYIVSEIMTSSRFLSIRNQLALSEREKEILKLVCEGKTNKEIAEKLFLTPATIDFHRQSIYKKTDISSVAQLVKYAIKNGFITLE